jgi:PAS domain S-box-containing protein
MKLENDSPDPATLGEIEFRELADHAPVMIWRARSDRHCDWFNKPWTDFTGRTQQQLIGYGWMEDIHADDLDACVDGFHQAFDNRSRFTLPYRVRRHDGQYRWMLDNGAPFYRKGEFAGYFGSCIDITEQRELEAHQQVLLSELNHRVKNNLQLIISLLQLSKMRAQGDEAKLLMQSAITRVVGVGAVQDELHRYGKGQVDLADFLPSLARGVINAQHSRTMTLRCETQSVCVSLQTASNLGLILNELLDNAIKHGNSNRVDLQLLNLDNNTAQISVIDQGPGFADEILTGAANSRCAVVSLIDALSKRCGATLLRDNIVDVDGSGARVRLTFALS